MKEKVERKIKKQGCPSYKKRIKKDERPTVIGVRIPSGNDPDKRYMKVDPRNIRRGEVYLMKLPAGCGSEQSGFRPAVVLSNNAANKSSPNITIAPITSQIKKRYQPTHVLIRNMRGLDKNSLVLLECMGTFSKDRLRKKIGTFNNRTMKRIDAAIREAVFTKSQGCDLPQK